MVIPLHLAAAPEEATPIMRTRRGLCYPKTITTTAADGTNGFVDDNAGVIVRKKRAHETIGGEDPIAGAGKRLTKRYRFEKEEASPETGVCGGGRKRQRLGEGEVAGAGSDMFDELPDDLVVCILCRVASSASSPSDLANAMLTCKRVKGLLFHPLVLSKASPKSLAIRAQNWSDSAHRFLKMCSDAGNLEACYLLGMIRFYCLENRGGGAALMARAAMGSHAAALYSLAVIQFNGSGGTKNDKDLRAGVALCFRAAFLGHVDALREFGHCLQDGYGVRQNVPEGRRFLVQANARELAAVLRLSPPWLATAHRHHHHRHRRITAAEGSSGCPLLSDFGCNVPAPEAHPANRFLSDWFGSSSVETGPNRSDGGLRLCSHVLCGRPETRRHEFRRCSVCGTVNYCSRACQALDWKLRHKSECSPMDRWLHQELDGAAVHL